MADDDGPRAAPTGETPIRALTPDFESVYRSSYRSMLGLARTVLADTGQAEDVVQEAFARCYARWDRVEAHDDPLPYVRSAVLNLCRGRLRRKPTPLRTVPDVPSAEEHALDRDRTDRMVAALRRLPVRQREVVALRYFGQLSTDEAAVALGIASGTVKAHLHRAVRALGADLEELQP